MLWSARMTFSIIWAIVPSLFVAQSSASSIPREPLSAVFAIRNATIHTNSKRVHSHSSFDLSFLLNSHDHVKISLEPNHNVLPHGLRINYFNADGTIGTSKELDRMSHKVYKGKAWTRTEIQDDWVPAGWARIMLRQDGESPLFDGSFVVDHVTHHIHLAENYLQTRHLDDPELHNLGHEGMVLYRSSDALRQEIALLRRSLATSQQPTCPADTIDFNTSPQNPVVHDMLSPVKRSWGSLGVHSLFDKRQSDITSTAGVNLISTIGQSAGCPTSHKVALVGVAADCTYTAQFPDKNAAQSNIISVINQASSVWENTFRISLAVNSINLFDSNCPGTPADTTKFNRACDNANYDLQARLGDFSAYRGSQTDNNSHWTLFTTCTGSRAIGLAWMGTACTQGSQSSNSSSTGDGAASNSVATVAGANVIVRTDGVNEWEVMAHETGHIFGAVHDCSGQTCQSPTNARTSQCCPLSSSQCDAGGKYIMNPASTASAVGFSPCTVGNICSALGKGIVRSSCLTDNRNVKTVTGPVCGNGIVEGDEQCDSGGRDSPCCDAKTCRLKSGAVCDDSNEDCCSACQFKAANTVCRASSGVCDPRETCTGNSSTCPADVRSPNGQGCGDGLTCASGTCTSRDQQCKDIMGSYTTDNSTRACGRNDCALMCASPQFGTDRCYGLSQFFIDGTPCGGQGHCDNGRCEGDSTGAQIKGWIDDNKPLVIGLSVGLGVLLIFILSSCALRWCRRRRNSRRSRVVNGAAAAAGAAYSRQPPPPPPGGWQGWTAPSAQQQGTQLPPMTMDQHHQDGYWQSSQPQMPPPAMQHGSNRYA